MKRPVLLLMLMLLAGLQAWAEKGKASPEAMTNGAFIVHVEDNDVDTAFELVTQDTGFTQLAVDSVLYVAFDTLAGPATDGKVDTAVVYLRGIRADNANPAALRYFTSVLRVGGGDTLSTGANADTFHIFESAYLDSAMNGDVVIFHTYASVVFANAISAGSVWQPDAHVFFGDGQRGKIEYVDAMLTSGTGDMDCEFRVWYDVHTDVDYTTDYAVLAKARLTTDDADKGGQLSYRQDWGGYGILMGEESYAAWMCNASANNSDVAVTIVYKRY